jgi:hypothetical protein
VRQSASQRNRNRFHWRNAWKKPTQNTEGKKRADQEDVDFAYLFVNATRKSAKSPISLVCLMITLHDTNWLIASVARS